MKKSNIPSQQEFNHRSTVKQSSPRKGVCGIFRNKQGVRRRMSVSSPELVSGNWERVG